MRNEGLKCMYTCGDQVPQRQSFSAVHTWDTALLISHVRHQCPSMPSPLHCLDLLISC